MDLPPKRYFDTVLTLNHSGKAWPAICVGLFVAFGGVLFGYDTGTIGGILAMPYWLKTFSTGYTVDGAPAITSSQSSMIVSILVSYNQLLGPSRCCTVAKWLWVVSLVRE